jgi:hypothetical protein
VRTDIHNPSHQNFTGGKTAHSEHAKKRTVTVTPARALGRMNVLGHQLMDAWYKRCCQKPGSVWTNTCSGLWKGTPLPTLCPAAVLAFWRTSLLPSDALRVALGRTYGSLTDRDPRFPRFGCGSAHSACGNFTLIHSVAAMFLSLKLHPRIVYAHMHI